MHVNERSSSVGKRDVEPRIRDLLIAQRSLRAKPWTESGQQDSSRRQASRTLPSVCWTLCREPAASLLLAAGLTDSIAVLAVVNLVLPLPSTDGAPPSWADSVVVREVFVHGPTSAPDGDDSSAATETSTLLSRGVQLALTMSEFSQDSDLSSAIAFGRRRTWLAATSGARASIED